MRPPALPGGPPPAGAGRPPGSRSAASSSASSSKLSRGWRGFGVMAPIATSSGSVPSAPCVPATAGGRTCRGRAGAGSAVDGTRPLDRVRRRRDRAARPFPGPASAAPYVSSGAACSPRRPPFRPRSGTAGYAATSVRSGSRSSIPSATPYLDQPRARACPPPRHSPGARPDPLTGPPLAGPRGRHTDCGLTAGRGPRGAPSPDAASRPPSQSRPSNRSAEQRDHARQPDGRPPPLGGPALTPNERVVHSREYPTGGGPQRRPGRRGGGGWGLQRRSVLHRHRRQTRLGHYGRQPQRSTAARSGPSAGQDRSRRSAIQPSPVCPSCAARSATSRAASR